MTAVALQACAHAVTVPLVETRSAPGEPRPQPVVEAAIDGHPVWLMADTGSSGLVLDRQSARGLGLALGQEDGAEDGAVQVRLTVGETAADFDAAVVFPRAPALVRSGLIGAFPPQGAFGMRSVRIDPGARTLTLSAPDEDPAAMLAHVDVALQATRCERLWLVPVSIGAAAAAPLLLDTGAVRTVVDAALAADAGLQAHAAGDDTLDSRGRAVPLQRVATAHLALGDFATDLPLRVRRADAYCGARGELGMDVLSRFRIVLDPTGRVLLERLATAVPE